MSEQITKDEQEKTLRKLSEQLEQIVLQMPNKDLYSITVNCGVCGKTKPLVMSYRCYQCGLWICPKCAGEHFGIDKSKLPKYIKPSVVDEG